MFFVFLLLSQLVIIAQCLLGSIVVLIKHTTHSVTKYVQQSLLTRQIDLVIKHIKRTSCQLRHVFITNNNYSLSSNNIDQDKIVSLDTDTTEAVVDNSANTHICNVLEDFVEGSVRYFDDDDDIGVLTIGKEFSRPIGMSTVNVRVKDNAGIIVHLQLQNCLYFPMSSVKIISVTMLAQYFNDQDGTWIKTCWYHSTFS